MGQPVETLAKDYTYWDEMVEFARRPDPTWAEENLETCLSTYGVDAVWVLDLEFRQIHATTDPAKTSLKRFPLVQAELEPILGSGPLHHFHVRHEGSILEVRAASIHRTSDSERKGRKFGYFLAGRLWTPERIQALGDLTECETSAGAKRSDLGEATIDYAAGAYRFSIRLAGPGESTCGWLNFRKASTAAREAIQASSVTVAWMTGLVAAFLSALFAALWFWMARPLSALTKSMEHGAPEILLPLSRSDNEYGRLAKTVLSSFEARSRLEEEVAARTRAQEDLDLSYRRLEAALETAEELARAAQAAAEAKADFLANMSHELRTPLNGVIGMADLLGSTRLTEEQYESVSIIATSGRHLLDIIGDILDLSKIEAGRMALESVPFGVVEAIEDAVAMCAPNAAARKLELVCDIHPSLDGEYLGDPLRVRQILLNLVGNALKFTTSGWVAVVGRAEENSAVVLEVADTGIGIPSDRLGAIFETFTQADASTSRKFGGTGLGLSICRRLARMMGGDIHVESEEGRGSVFTLRLPLERRAGSPGCEALGTAAGSRAMVADPCPPSREAMRRRLEAMGFETSTAEGVDEAAEVLRGPSPFALTVVNVTTDEAGALQALQTLRAAAGPKMSLIAAEPYSMSLRNAGLDDPKSFTLRKPWRVADLRKRLRAAFDERDARDPNQTANAGETLEGATRFPGLRVLVVDDNAINIKVITRMLERVKVSFDVATNGEAAVAKAKDDAFDLILMDVHMPILDGLEATRQIRAFERQGVGGSTIVALTANHDDGERKRCLAAGMDDFLVKPVPSEALASLLLDVWSRSERRAA